MKQCDRCHLDKDLSLFKIDNRLKTGYSNVCKSCDAKHQQDMRLRAPDKFRIKEATKYKNNKEAWLKFFIENYGESPHCEICDQSLNWRSSKSYNDGLSVCWDHVTEESLKVKRTPSQWLANHQCTVENQEIWLSFNFGILCNVCNCSLPTHNRLQWLENAMKYMESKDGVRL